MIVDLFTCKDCGGQYNRAEMFWCNKRTPTGQCRPCRRKVRRSWYERNTSKAIASATAWKRANRDRWLDANRKSKYGVPYGYYAEQLEAQGGGCAICGSPAPADKSLHVDHDHETGQVRGLLCDLCNRGLGYFKDRADLLTEAATYLRGWAA